MEMLKMPLRPERIFIDGEELPRMPYIPLSPEGQALVDKWEREWNIHGMQEDADRALGNAIVYHWDIGKAKGLLLGMAYDEAKQFADRYIKRFERAYHSAHDRIIGCGKWEKRYPNGDLAFLEKMATQRFEKNKRVLKPKLEKLEERLAQQNAQGKRGVKYGQRKQRPT